MWLALPIYNDVGGIAAASKRKESEQELSATLVGPKWRRLRAGEEKGHGLGTSPALAPSVCTCSRAKQRKEKDQIPFRREIFQDSQAGAVGVGFPFPGKMDGNHF